ncbi:UNVERIFIED_CONTAM: hypothetical protein Sindi_0660300 [Sesamum indicum]
MDRHLADLAETFNTPRKYHMKQNPSKCAFGVRSGRFLEYMATKKRIESIQIKFRAIQEMKPPANLNEVKLAGRITARSRFISRSAKHGLPFFKVLKKTKNFI